MWSYSYLKYLKTPFCESFAVVHGPLTASNLLVTWRRRHGDAKITRQLARSRDWSLKNPWMGARWGSKFPRVMPREVGADNICLRERKSQTGTKGEKGDEMCSDHFLSSSTVLKTSPPSSHPPHQFRCCGVFKLYVQVEYFCLCACVQGALGFTDACTGFGESNRSRGLGPVNKTSAQSCALSTFLFSFSPSVWKAMDHRRGKLRGTCRPGMPVYLLVHAPWAIN